MLAAGATNSSHRLRFPRSKHLAGGVTLSISDTQHQIEIGQLLQAGYAALAQGRWAESERAFKAALEYGDLPEALEGLGLAASSVDDVSVTFDSHERAYRLYRERGDRLGAARVASVLGGNALLLRGEEAIANGWLQRAHRLLDGVAPALEHGQLAAIEGFIALLFHHDVLAAKRASADTLTLARTLGSIDLEIAALGMEGLALVNEGRAGEGMRCLDEATAAAMAGEVQSLDTVILVCCFLINACEHLRDFDRAAQWCERFTEFCRHYGFRSVLAYCRTHYAAVLLWRGAWMEAEAELISATRELSATRSGQAAEGILRLGELRRRQGRLDEAATLIAQAPGHALATLGNAALAFDAGDARTAGDLVERFLRQVPADDRMERIDGLELALRVHCALGHLDEARAALAEIEAAATAVDTSPLRGFAAAGRGAIAAATGDLDLARRGFEDAVDLFQQSGAPFETARARIELARALAALDRPASAVTEARLALDSLQALGAAPEAARATALLANLGASLVPVGATTPLPAGLTRREAEVLGMLARGLSNHEIARALFLSVRTVERHISTIYAKIGAEGPAARAAAGAFAFTHNLTAELRS
jgi:DNA-binding NarL/FixJ family response regulator